MLLGGLYSESLVELQGGRPRILDPRRTPDAAGDSTEETGRAWGLAYLPGSGEGRRTLLERLNRIVFEDPVAQKSPLAMLSAASFLPAVLSGHKHQSCCSVDGLVAVVGSAAALVYAALLIAIDYRMRHQVGCATAEVPGTRSSSR